MPRWRTMIEPAVTSWPSPALTPRRWPTLSRPFLELEPAFLCAIASTRPSSLARPVAASADRRWRRPGCAAGRGLGLGGGLAARRRPRGSASAALRLSAFGRPPSPWRRALALAGGLGLGSAPCASSPASAAVGSAASLAASAWSAAAFLRGGLGGRAVGLLALGLDVLGQPPWRRSGRPSAMSAMRRIGQLGTVALLDAAARLGPVLEDDDLLAAILAHDVGASRWRRHRRSADRWRPRHRRRRGGRDRMSMVSPGCGVEPVDRRARCRARRDTACRRSR